MKMTRVLLILALAVIAAHIIQGDPAIRPRTKEGQADR